MLDTTACASLEVLLGKPTCEKPQTVPDSSLDTIVSYQPALQRGKNLSKIIPNKKSKAKKTNATTRRVRPIAQKGTQARKRNSSKTANLTSKNKNTFSSEYGTGVLQMYSSIPTSNGVKLTLLPGSDASHHVSSTMPTINYGGNNSQSSFPCQNLPTIPSSGISCETILATFDSTDLASLPSEVSFAHENLLSNQVSNGSSPIVSIQQPLTFDPFSYLYEVFDFIFAPYVICATPLLQNIRCLLIKRYITDIATLELKTHPITNFEALNDFVNIIFQRTGLLP